MYLNLLVSCLNIFKHEFNRFKIQIWKYRNMICFERGREVALLLLLLLSPPLKCSSVSLSTRHRNHILHHSHPPSITATQILPKSNGILTQIIYQWNPDKNYLQCFSQHDTEIIYSNIYNLTVPPIHIQIWIQIQNIPQLRFLVIF